MTPQQLEELEEKYDALLAQVEAKERQHAEQQQRPQFVRLNRDICASGLYKEIMTQNRKFKTMDQRKLGEIVKHNQRENQEFLLKYRYFQLHKWKILKYLREQALQLREELLIKK